MITWKEFNEKMNNRFGVIFKKADDLYFNVASEINIGENIEIEDIQALKYLQNLFPMRGNLYIITDLCYCKDNGPHVVNSEKVDNFVYTYMENYAEPFFSTDVVIVNFEEGLIWVLFHEGICWLTTVSAVSAVVPEERCPGGSGSGAGQERHCHMRKTVKGGRQRGVSDGLQQENELT